MLEDVELYLFQLELEQDMELSEKEIEEHGQDFGNWERFQGGELCPCYRPPDGGDQAFPEEVDQGEGQGVDGQTS